jgi:hypothetical protein
LPVVEWFGPADSIWNACCDAGSRAPGHVAFHDADASGCEDAGRRHAGMAVSDEGPSLIRDTPWVLHRYLAPPAAPYKLLFAAQGGRVLGYAAYRVRHVNGRQVGDIPEVVAPGDAAAGGWLLREVAGRLRAEGADVAISLAVPGSPDDRRLLRRGFVFSWGDFSVDTVILDPAMTIDALRSAGPWILTGGDFDVV